MLLEIGLALGKSLVIIVGLVLPLAGVLTLMERRYSAYMQDRLGPTRAHFMKFGGRPFVLFGIFHVVADGLKMFFKESFVPGLAARGLFFWAPIISLGVALALFFPIPFGPPILIGDLVIPLQVTSGDAGFLLLLGIVGLGIYGVLLGAWASGNKFGLLGGMRGAAQLISYEIPLTLSLVGILMALGTTDLLAAVGKQTELLWGVVPKWGLFLQPLGAVLYFWAAVAETKRGPFDVPEGESEIIGFFVEYSSMGFGAFLFSEFVEIIALAAVFTTLFLGGFTIPGLVDGTLLFGQWDIGSVGAGLVGLGVFGVKVFVLSIIQIQLRWTLPRVRYDQLMHLGWRIMLPLALVNLVVTAALLWVDPSANLLATVGLLLIGLYVLIFLAGIGVVRRTPTPVVEA